MSAIKKLANLCKKIRLLDDQSLLDKSICAYAAISDISNKDKTNVHLSYTSVLRDLRKSKKEDVRSFQEKFKEVFEQGLDENLENPEEIALTSALKHIHWKK
jgi:hypothetical protein